MITQGLFQEAQEHGDNNAGFQSLTETDEKDFLSVSWGKQATRIPCWIVPGTANTLVAATMLAATNSNLFEALCQRRGYRSTCTASRDSLRWLSDGICKEKDLSDAIDKGRCSAAFIRSGI